MLIQMLLPAEETFPCLATVVVCARDRTPRQRGADRVRATAAAPERSGGGVGGDRYPARTQTRCTRDGARTAK